MDIGGLGDVAAGATVSVVRTWGTPWNAEVGETYLGPEIFLQAFGVRIGVGALYRVDGEDRTGRLIPGGVPRCGVPVGAVVAANHRDPVPRSGWRAAILGVILAGSNAATPVEAARIVVGTAALGGTPQVASLAVEGMISPDWPGSLFDEAFILGVEVGTGGGKVSVGYGLVWKKGRPPRDYSAGPFEYAALGATLTGLRTWGDPWNTETKETYLGPDIFLQALLIRLELGVLYRVGGPESSGRVIPRVALGVGYLWAP